MGVIIIWEELRFPVVDGCGIISSGSFNSIINQQVYNQCGRPLP